MPATNKPRKVSLKIRVVLEDGSRPFLTPAISANHKHKRFAALVKGKAVEFSDGVYYLRYVKDGKPGWEQVGEDYQIALRRKKERELILSAEAAGLTVVETSATTEWAVTGSRSTATRPITPPITGVVRISLADRVATYNLETKAHKRRRTWLAYKGTLERFVESAPGLDCLEDITREDILRFMTHLRKRGNKERTVHNQVLNLKVFLNHHKVPKLLLKTDKVRFTMKKIAAYSKGQLQQLLAAADQQEREMLLFFLYTGGRDQEAMFAAWPTIDFDRGKFMIEESDEYSPKDYEEAGIPMPMEFLEVLRARRRRNPKSRYIFENSDGDPQGHFLRIVKRLALRAGLNCQHCYTRGGLCCQDHPVCKRFELHKLRKTFATMHHANGVAVRTIQKWLRHSSLETTLRYLDAEDDDTPEMRFKVNTTFAGLLP